MPEIVDEPQVVDEKVATLAELINNASHVVVHCGAGISTTAGIPDFRGPNGVWTLEKKGIKSETTISFETAKPTYTHMALKALVEAQKVHFIISQNIDGLFLKTGIQRRYLAELHGNFYLDECNVCGTRYIRNSPSPTMGLKVSAQPCSRPGRPCRGLLRDTILDWEDALPESELEGAESNALTADLSICLGSSLQINPAGRLPFIRRKGKTENRKTAIVNLQKTKYDKKAHVVIHDYVDLVMKAVCEKLNVKVEPYSEENDLTIFEDGPLRVWK